MPRGPAPIEWRCPACQALLGVERDAELHIRYKTAIYIALRPLAIALGAARRPVDAGLEAAWKAAGQAPKGLASLVDALRPELARWPGELLLGHYGGVRGLDAMKHADALATLGDPWPDVDDVATEVAFLGLCGP